MKKLLFGAVSLLLLASCSGNSASEKTNEGNTTHSDQTVVNSEFADTTSRIDSVADTSSQDKIPQIDVDYLYKKGLVLSKGKKSKKWVGDNDDPDVTLPVTITNNTGIDLNPVDYIISYNVDEMYATGGGLESRVISATQKGPKIANGEKVTVKLFKSNVLDIINPKVKLKLDKKKFAERLKEAK